MKIGVFIPKADPFSMRIYREGITKELEPRGIKVVLKSDIKEVLDGIDRQTGECSL